MVTSRTVWIAFIRAIMIGREGFDRPVVLDLFRAAGAANPVSYIATGNVSFEAEVGDVATIVATVEAGLEAIAQRPKPLFVRTLDELVELLESDPFADAPFGGSQAGEVLFFRDRTPNLALPIESPHGTCSVFATSDREAFAVSRSFGGHPAVAAGGRLERLTGQPVTARAWSTLELIARKLES